MRYCCPLSGLQISNGGVAHNAVKEDSPWCRSGSYILCMNSLPAPASAALILPTVEPETCDIYDVEDSVCFNHWRPSTSCMGTLCEEAPPPDGDRRCRGLRAAPLVIGCYS